MNQVETEYHFIMCCPRYTEIRHKYLGKIAWPSVNKFYNLMSTKNKRKLDNIAMFLVQAFKIRKDSLSDL